MTEKLLVLFLIFTVFLFSQGCGLLYGNVVLPQSTDFSNTKIGTKKSELNSYGVRIPIFLPGSRFRISAKWTAEEIKKAAEMAGIKKINFTESREFSLFFGTISKSTLIIYGD